MTPTALVEFEFDVQHNHRTKEYAKGDRGHFTREDVDMLADLKVGHEVKRTASRQEAKQQ